MNYDEENNFLSKVETKNVQNERKKLNKEDIDMIKSKYKNVPDDYFDYLKYVGYGSFRECQFMVYQSLMTLSDIGIEIDNKEFNDLVFFGDSFSGDLSGFNLKKNEKVIEYLHVTNEIYETEKTFKEYIKEQMLMDENGNDLREY